MKSVFLLQHSYKYRKDDLTIEDTKVLGIFSTREKAEAVIELYKTLPGFKDFSDDCFYLDEYELNMKEWTEGFITPEVFEKREEPKTPEEIEYVKGCLRERIREKQEELKELQEELKRLQEDLNNIGESY
jgi:homoserine kinase type II